MSGSNSLPPMTIKVDGAQAAQQAIDGVVAAADRLGAAGGRVSGQLGVRKTQAEQASGASRNFGTMIGQAGYQVQDFAVQVASGQSALTAFVQQGSQLAGIFGPTGIIVGAALAVGGIAAQFLFMGESAEQANKKIEEGFKANQRAGQELTSVIQALSAELLTAAQRAGRLADAQRNVALTDGQRMLLRLTDEQTAAVSQYTTAQAELARIARARTQLEVDLAAAPPRARAAIESDLREARGSEFAAQSRFDAAVSEMNRTGTGITTVRGLIDRVSLIGGTGTEEFGPPAPDRPRRGGGGSRLPDADLQAGWLAVQDQNRDREAAERAEAREWDQEQERREREAERAQERAVEANRRTTDRIVDYGANAFADMFDKNGRGFDGLMDTMERTARQTFARIAAEAIIRPIVAPIVQSLGLGALGTGNGGFSGIFGGTVSGGGAAAPGGGVGVLPSGGGSGIGSLFSTSTWGGSGGWFSGFGGLLGGMPSTAGTNAAIASMGTGANGAALFGPAVPASTGMTIGGASLGAWGAGIGIGYMGGSMLGSYIAQTPAQRTNSQIGAGGGAVAGAAIGTAIFPGVGTVIGGALGGLVGGGAGGMIGPSSQFSGGDVGIGVGADGLLRITGTGGKNWNAGAARDSVQQQLDQINAVLRASGTTISGAGGFDWDRGSGGQTIGFAGSGGSTNVFGPSEIFGRVRGNLTSTNDNMRTALQSSAVQSFGDVVNVAQWLASTYEPLSKVVDYTERFSDAIAAQNKVYDDAIARARELGLAESGLVEAREKSLSATLGARDTSVHNALTALQVDELRATGNPADARRASMLEFSLSSSQRLTQLQEFLRNSGYGDETSLFQESVARLNSLFVTQRKSLAEQLDANAGGSGRGLMEELTIGTLGGLSSATRFAAASKNYRDARESGNLDRITAAGRSLATVGRDYLGTSERFGSVIADISRDVRRAGGDPVGLGVFLEGQAAANMTLERMYSLSGESNATLKRMERELVNLRSVFTALMQRQVA